MSTKEQKEQFKLYKQDVERRGKAFFPHAMFHDTVMSVVVVSVIVGLASLWYFDSGEEPGDSGILGPRYTDEADPGTISFTPRPDWYFFFLFYLLRIFKWPESVILATIGIPTILLVLLLAVPFIDRRRERRLIRRPVAVVAALLVIASMGILTYKGATAREVGGGEEFVPSWLAENNLPSEAEPGAELFAVSGCLNCHVYLGDGATNLGAPELTEEGLRGRGIEFQIQHLRDPRSTTPSSQMPAFNALTDEQLRNLAIFLEASKGPQGGG